MINSKILNILGLILILLGIVMVPSSLWSLAASQNYSLIDHEFFDFIAILKSALIYILIGGSIYLVTKYRTIANPIIFAKIIATSIPKEDPPTLLGFKLPKIARATTATIS